MSYGSRSARKWLASAAAGFGMAAFALTTPVQAGSAPQPQTNVATQFASTASTITAKTLLPVDGLTPAQVETILADLQNIFDQIHPDIVLFGEYHCQTKTRSLLRMINARGNYGAGYYEQSPGKQSSIDSIMKWSIKTNLSEKQIDLLKKFEADTVNNIAEDASSGCGVEKIREINAKEEVALAKDMASQGRSFTFDDYNVVISGKLQDELRTTRSKEIRRQFDLARHNEIKLAVEMSAASQKYPVWALGGAAHYLEEIPGVKTSVRQNLPGRTVITVALEDAPGELAKWQQEIENRGNRFVGPDIVIKLYGPNPGVVLYEAKQASPR